MNTGKTILGIAVIGLLIGAGVSKSYNNQLKLISTDLNSVKFSFKGIVYNYNHVFGDSKVYGDINGLHLVVSSEFDKSQNYIGVSFSMYKGNKIVGDMVKQQLFQTTAK